MTDLLKATILGIVQGLTEFLPISSSGHLALAKKLPGFAIFANPHLDKMFDVALHGGTLLALLIYFRPDLARIGHEPTYRRFILPVLIATLPIALVMALFEKTIEKDLNLAVMVAIPMILFGIVLWLADRYGRKTRDLPRVRRWDVMLMTLSQAVALIPGVSRSGITMTTGLLQGMTRETAVRLSFLLSIPAVAGPPLLFAYRVVRGEEMLTHSGVEMLAVGVIAAAVSGYAAISYLLKFVQTKSFTPFMVYRVLLGLAVFALLAAGMLQR